MSDDEIITAVRIPTMSRRRFAGFRKLALSSDGFPVASVAASISIDSSGVTDGVRIVLGGIVAVPWRAIALEKYLIGRVPREEDIAQASRKWISDSHPLEGNRWKLGATSALVRQVVEYATMNKSGQ